jgi:hypothetical protein
MTARDQSGQAVIEALLLGLLLLVPLIWTLGVLADLHRSALATTAAAREAGFDAARSPSLTQASAAITRAVEEALADQGLDPAAARVRWSAGTSFVRGNAVDVEVAYPVTVLQAPLLGRVAGPSLWVRARHSARIDPFRSIE